MQTSVIASHWPFLMSNIMLFMHCSSFDVETVVSLILKNVQCKLGPVSVSTHILTNLR